MIDDLLSFLDEEVAGAMAESSKAMILLVTGGRDFNDTRALEKILDAVHRRRPIIALVHGGARGADRLAGDWASSRGIWVLVVPALWGCHGRSAGPRRNQAMLDLLRPDACVAFPGGAGTADMVSRAKAAGLAVWEPMKEKG